MKKRIINYLFLTLLSATALAMKDDKKNKSDKPSIIKHNSEISKFYRSYYKTDNIQFPQWNSDEFLELFFSTETRHLFRSNNRLSVINREKASKQATIKKIKQEISDFLETDIVPEDKIWISLLCEASYHEECYDLIESILKKNVNPNQSNIADHSPLYIACWSGAIKNAALLLDYNANPNLGNSHRETPLMAAVKKGHLTIVKLLCQHKDTSINAREDFFGHSALIYAFNIDSLITYSYDMNKNVCEHIVRALLNAGANPNLLNKKRMSAIDVARENEFHDLVELMESYSCMPQLIGHNSLNLSMDVLNEVD